MTTHVRCSSAFDWLVADATAIFCTRGLKRSGPPFKVESEPLKTPIPVSEFESKTFCLVVSVLIPRRTRSPAFVNLVQAINVYVNSIEWNWRSYLLDERKYKMQPGNPFLLAAVKIAWLNVELPMPVLYGEITCVCSVGYIFSGTNNLTGNDPHFRLCLWTSGLTFFTH